MCLAGPEMANVMGPTLAKAGDNVTFSCNAISTPPSMYTWYFNDTLVSNESAYVTPPLTSNMTGHYMCMAFNSITGKNSTAFIWLNVVGESCMSIFFFLFLFICIIYIYISHKNGHQERTKELLCDLICLQIQYKM